MTKQRKRYNRYRSLKTIAYLLGWPLLVLMVLIGSITFYSAPAFKNTWYYGAVAAAALWVVSIIIQLIFNLLCKKKLGRAVFSLVITLILTLGVGLAFDVYMGGINDLDTFKIESPIKGKLTTIADEQKAYGVELKNYNYQINHYITLSSKKSSLTDEYNNLVDKFCTVYNVNPEGKIYGKTNADLSEFTQNKDDKAYYSANGMYADGYVFSMEEAVDILITIQETRNEYKKKGKDADEELKNAVETAKNSSAWSTYTNSAAYKKAYGADGTAMKLMLSETKINGILSALGEHLGSAVDSLSSLIDVEALIPGLGELLNEDLDMETLVSYLSVFLDITPHVCPVCEEEYEYDSSEVADGECSACTYGGDAVKLVTKAQLPWACTTCGEVMGESDVTTEHCATCDADHRVLSCTNCHTAYETVPEASTADAENAILSVLNGLGITELSVEAIEDFAINFLYYQSPSTKPIFEFIKDEKMKDYGYAVYYAQRHGASVGSILDGETLGLVGLGINGYPSSGFAFSLADLYKLRAYNSYMPTYYPLFAVRRYVLALGGFVALMGMACYHFSRKQDEAFAALEQGGKQ